MLDQNMLEIIYCLDFFLLLFKFFLKERLTNIVRLDIFGYLRNFIKGE